MKSLSSSELKNQLGGVLASLDGPLRIERHGKAVAYLLPAGSPPADARQMERQLARLAQANLEKDRLLRHQRIALELLLDPPEASEARVRAARSEVERWERQQLCSTDYIRRWRDLLGQPLPELAAAMSSDLQGWGSALRQNSPWRT